MAGIEAVGKPLMRACSMFSASREEQLVFLGIKVPDGPLTWRLQGAQPGGRYRVGQQHGGGTLILQGKVAELAYDHAISRELPGNEFFGEPVANRLIYSPTGTRERFRNQGRVAHSRIPANCPPIPVWRRLIAPLRA